LSTDVLFVDEVLAVGDASFQKKCLGTMREIGDSGRTVVFVSHNMTAVENLCKRTVWMAEGQTKQIGATREVIRAYLNSFEATVDQTLDLTAVRERKGSGHVRLSKMEFLNDGEDRLIHSGGPLRIRLHYECQKDMVDLYFGLRIFSNLGTLISDVNSWANKQEIPLAPKGKGSIDLEINPLNLMPSTYYVGLWAATSGDWHDVLDNVAKFDVEPSDYFGSGRGVNAEWGLVLFPYQWKASGSTPPRNEMACPLPTASP
jgi:lipopolysaccharide transport system ATP-binding protein